MFLNTLINENGKLAEAVFDLHKSGILLPDTYVVDVDSVEANARIIKDAADKAGVTLYFMSKQMGRNPYLCKLLMELGYIGAVVVDYREAAVMMENGIPIAHAGCLVQTPKAFLPKLLDYGVGLITVYSIEKAHQIDDICRKKGKTQNICLRVFGRNDMIYPGQQGGTPLESVEKTINEFAKLKNINVAALTAFPSFLYDENERKVKPCANLGTLLKAHDIAKDILGRDLELNMPSCTQTSLMPEIAAEGGKSAEPGSAFIGTVPNNEDGSARETIAIAYLSEVSHKLDGKTYCYGGGLYPRGNIKSVLVGKAVGNAKFLTADPPTGKNIDYYMSLDGDAEIGDCALMSFRPQIFTGRSRVALLRGLSSGKAKIAGIYDSQGRLL